MYRRVFVLTANVLLPPNKPFDCSGGLAAFIIFLNRIITSIGEAADNNVIILLGNSTEQW